MVTFYTPIPNTLNEIRSGIRELRSYEEKQDAIEKEVWWWFFYGTIFSVVADVGFGFKDIYINWITSTIILSTIGLLFLFTSVSRRHEVRIQEWKHAERVEQQRMIRSTQARTPVISTEQLSQLQPNIDPHHPLTTSGISGDDGSQSVGTTQRKKRNRNRKEIKSDIAKLSDKHRKELVMQLYEMYLKIPETNTTNTTRWNDLDVVSRSELEPEELQSLQTNDNEEDDE